MTKNQHKSSKPLLKPKPALCIIPARSGSKRVKNKNIRLLNGIPLIHYSINTAIQCKFDPIIISTNSKTIANIALQYNSSIAIIMRPNSISQDDSTDQEVINHIVESLNAPQDTIIAYLRPTTPLRNRRVVMRAYSRFMAHPGFTSLRCVEELTESAYKSFTLNNGQLIPILGPLDNANKPNYLYPKTYRNNGYIDLFRYPWIDEGLSMGFVTLHTLEIDTEEDLRYVEWISQSAIVKR